MSRAFIAATIWSASACLILQGTPGNPPTRVRMDHRMQLSADGRSLGNAVWVSIFGIPLGSVTETFRRGRVAVRGAGPDPIHWADGHSCGACAHAMAASHC